MSNNSSFPWGGLESNTLVASLNNTKNKGKSKTHISRIIKRSKSKQSVSNALIKCSKINCQKSKPVFLGHDTFSGVYTSKEEPYTTTPMTTSKTKRSRLQVDDFCSTTKVKALAIEQLLHCENLFIHRTFASPIA